MEKTITTNTVTLIGEIVSEFTFSHTVFGEGFYMADMAVMRLSEKKDIIPIMVSERLMDVKQDYSKQIVHITGQFRSYNRRENNRNRLILYAFVQQVEFIDKEDFKPGIRDNDVFLEGTICKQPVFRETPLGREIVDVMLAVNRAYGKSDYIPCIAWSRNARFIAGLNIGTKLQVNGRIQSREYNKLFGEGEVERRTAYEVSVARFEVKEQFDQKEETEGQAETDTSKEQAS